MVNKLNKKESLSNYAASYFNDCYEEELCSEGDSLIESCINFVWIVKSYAR